MKYDNVSFTKEAHADFLELPKSEQISYLAANLSPSGDTVRAQQLLKGVKHGDIGSRVDTKSSENKSVGTTSKGNGAGGEGLKSGATESKD